MSDPMSKTKPSRRRRFLHRDESGLTTLEWLLIVAAVAGLAALAVVLVQNVVDDTAEQISGSSARVTAARVAADDINQRALADVPTGSTAPLAEASWNEKVAAYTRDCNRLEITYGDIQGLSTDWVPLTVPASYNNANNKTAWENSTGGLNDPTKGCQVNI